MAQNEADTDDLQFVELRRLNEIEKIKKKTGRKKRGKNSKLTEFEDRLQKVHTDKSYSFAQDLKQESTNSVKSVACKKQTRVKTSAPFISTKLLVNSKMLVASFIYDCIGTFFFPNDMTHSLYNQNKILKVIPYLPIC